MCRCDVGRTLSSKSDRAMRDVTPALSACRRPLHRRLVESEKPTASPRRSPEILFALTPRPRVGDSPARYLDRSVARVGPAAGGWFYSPQDSCLFSICAFGEFDSTSP